MKVSYLTRNRTYEQYIEFYAHTEVEDLDPVYADSEGKLCVFRAYVSKDFPEIIDAIQDEIKKYGWKRIRREELCDKRNLS